MPLSVDEYQVAQSYSFSIESLNNTGGGDGLEVKSTKNFHDLLLNSKPSRGVYTHKIYHMHRYLNNRITLLSSDRIPAPTFHSLIGYRPLAIKSSWPIKVSLEAVTKKCRCYVETPVNVAPFFRNLFSFCYDTIYLVMYLINCDK